MAVIVLGSGCTKKPDDTARIDDPPDLNEGDNDLMASQQIQPATSTDPSYDPTSSTTPERGDDFGSPTNPVRDQGVSVPSGQMPSGGIVGDQSKPFQSPLTIAPANEDLSVKNRDEVFNRLQLSPDLDPIELIDFLGQADQYMQLLMSGRAIKDRQEAFEEMNRVVTVKLEASRRLAKHPDASASEKIEGSRGELQALSHLAAQGNLEAAEELATLAKTNLDSDDPQLVADSRVVLIGFAIEELQAGKEGAADRIVKLVQAVESSDEQPDVPALMIMGHARGLLAQYEFDEQMVKVRQRILDLFAGSANPEIAKMAAQAAGNVRFDTVEKLRSAVVGGRAIASDQWAESVQQLIDEAPDLVTVQYLAGAALEFEAAGEDDLALATYELMKDRFDDPKSATAREVELAMQARQARERVIGNIYAPDLPSVSGANMSLSNYKGKVVLMPFWASGFPQSLQIIPKLKELQKEFSDSVAIVGMNLDPAGTRVDEFEPDKQLGFPSFRSESSASDGGGNPVAAQFGMVSMPFVAILDQEQRIIALDFTGSKLRPTVQRLLKK